MTKIIVWKGSYRMTFWEDIENDIEVTFGIVKGYARDWDLLRATGLDSLDGVSDEVLCRLCIAKWEVICKAYAAGAFRIHCGGGETCAFCRQYRWLDGTCKKCPVALYTHNPYCYRTPYDDYHIAFDASSPHTMNELALKEVMFLNEVLNYIRKENERD